MNFGFYYGIGIILLLAGALAPLISDKRLLRRLSILLNIAGSLALIIFSAALLYSKQQFFWQLDGFIAPLSIAIDPLAAFFIIITSIISFCAGIYSLSYAEHLESRKGLFASLASLFVLSMVLVVSTSSLLLFLFFWELMSVASFLLVMSDYKKPETQKAGTFYFIMTQFSTVFLITAFILIYQHTGSLEISELKEMPLSLANIIFVLLFIGFGTKAGMIPFHKWLPYAHPASPSPISALMSGVMIKVAIYGILRFLFIFPEQQLWWGIIILAFGTISAFLGVIYALKEHDLKRLLAYHSIENIGIILMGIGLYIIFGAFELGSIAILSLAAALFHTLNHALFKSLLFLSAGSVVYATHTKNIEEMGGLIKKMPYTAMLFLIGAVSISALPPFNGFVSELMLFQAFFQLGSIPFPLLKGFLLLSLSLLALTSALAAACFVKAFGTVFLALPRSKESEHAAEVPKTMIFGPAILALLCAVLGIFSYQIFKFIGRSMGFSIPLPNILGITIVIVLMSTAAISIVSLASEKKKRVSETWGCGIYSQNSRMEYTASGFSEPIVTIFAPIYRTKKLNRREYFDSSNAIFKEGYAQIQMFQIFEEYIYMPIVRVIAKASAKLYKIQNRVELDSYIFYCFIAIVALLAIIGMVTL